MEAFQDTSAKDLRSLFTSVDKNNSDSIEVSELSNLLELTGKSRSRAEAELIFQVIDHQNKGAISFSQLNETLAFVAKRLNTPLFIKPADLIMPLITKVVKKRHQNGSSIWEHFKNQQNKVGMPEFARIYQELLGIALSTEEATEVEAFIEQRFKVSDLSAHEVGQFFMVGIRHNSLMGGDPALAATSANYIRGQCEAKGIKVGLLIPRF